MSAVSHTLEVSGVAQDNFTLGLPSAVLAFHWMQPGTLDIWDSREGFLFGMLERKLLGAHSSSLWELL
jgi:hypothetical protein